MERTSSERTERRRVESSLRRTTICVGLAAGWLGACGARTELTETDGGDGGRGTQSTSTVGVTTTSTTQGSTTGAGGSSCVSLAWAGDPVEVPQLVGASPTNPRFVDVGSALALVFEVDSDAQHLLASGTIAPWDTWPPSFGAFDAHFPVVVGTGSFVVSRGDPGTFAFAVRQPAPSSILGEAVPGENGSTFVEYPGDGDETRFLARSPIGEYLVGHGAPNELFLDRLVSFAPDPIPITQGPFTCSEQAIRSAAIADPQGFLVASSNVDAFQACAGGAPDGEPRVVQLVRVSGDSSTSLTTYTAPGAVGELLLVPRGAGAWLGVRTTGSRSNVLEVFEVSEEGIGPDIHIVGADAEEDAIAPIDGGFAHAHADPGLDALSGSVALDLWFSSGESVFAPPLSGLGPSRPEVTVGPSRTSFLMTFVDTSQGEPRMMVARADCVGGL